MAIQHARHRLQLKLRLLSRIVRTRDPRWWLVLGAVLGLGLLNKFTVLVAVASYGIALVLQPERSVLWNRWVVGGAAITLAIWAPNLWWQGRNGWPVFEFSQAIAGDAAENRLVMLPVQVLLLGPPLFVVALLGGKRLVRDPGWRPYRFVAIGPVVCIAILLASGGKPYYSAGALPAVLAAGAVVVTERSTGRRRVWLGVWLAANLCFSAVLALPILPASAVGDSFVAAVNPDVLETIGWPEFVDQVAAVVDELTVEERDTAVILTANYGEAGALERWGPSHRLPPVYSGHNSYADFGVPPDRAGPIVVVGYDDPTGLLVGCSREATLRSSFDVDNEENGQAVWICRAPLRPWADLWPTLRHVS